MIGKELDKPVPNIGQRNKKGEKDRKMRGEWRRTGEEKGEGRGRGSG
jgi:hypothetical protein